jgi:transcriptional regulator with XRE-family HTH domain
MPTSLCASDISGDIFLSILPRMDWVAIRSAFIRLRGSRTQQEIAVAGDLYQSDISKLESNDNLGPAVETFVRAVQGLGMPVSDFFRQLETGQPSPMASSDQAPAKEPSGERALPPYPSDEELTRRVIRTLTGWVQPQSHPPQSPTQDRESDSAARAGETEHDLHHRRRARRAARKPKTGRSRSQ